jgi:hypothetical protein
MNWLYLSSSVLIFWLSAVADRSTCIDYAVTFPDNWKMRANHGKEACVYEEACWSKKVSFRRTKQTLSCHVTGHLSWAPSETTCRNEEHYENVEGAGNIVSSTSGGSPNLSLNQYVCRKSIHLLVYAFGLRFVCRVSNSAHFTTSIHIIFLFMWIWLTFSCNNNL